MSKGNAILVEGRLRENKWEQEDGQTKRRMEIIAQTI
jgi:single-stranded DNA-binding protein